MDLELILPFRGTFGCISTGWSLKLNSRPCPPLVSFLPTHFSSQHSSKLSCTSFNYILIFTPSSMYFRKKSSSSRNTNNMHYDSRGRLLGLKESIQQRQARLDFIHRRKLNFLIPSQKEVHDEYSVSHNEFVFLKFSLIISFSSYSRRLRLFPLG